MLLLTADCSAGRLDIYKKKGGRREEREDMEANILEYHKEEDPEDVEPVQGMSQTVPNS